MQRRILAEIPDYPESKCFPMVKENVMKLLSQLQIDKNLSTNKKEAYSRIMKEMDWGMSKVISRWPAEIERTMENLLQHLQDFQLSLVEANNVGICGGGRAVKNAEMSFLNVVGYQQIFILIGHFQDKNLKEQLVANVLNVYDKIAPKPPPTVVTVEKTREIVKPVIERIESPRPPEKCKYCELYLSLSLLPNGSIAKNLLSTLPDVEWVNGMVYEEGKLFPQDIPKAIGFYQRAVKKNNSEALYKLGSLNEQGLYGKPNEYINMWKRAAEMGSLEATTDMGYLYEKGIKDQDTGQLIMPPDSNKAHQYYIQAANENFPRGLNNLASFYQLDPQFKNPQKSLLYFKKAIEAGYVKAMFNLGLCYSQGFLKSTDQNKAKELFRRAAQLGDFYSKLFYVDLLLNGDTSNCTEDDLVEANKFCREMIAEEEERAEAYYFLGVMYEGGLGAPQEPKTALLYFLKAAKLNYAHAVIKLADCYRTGFGVEQDYKEAMRFYQQVKDRRPEVLVNIGMMYEEGSQELMKNYQKAFEYYYEACNQGVPEGFTKVGAMYRFGKYVKKDEAKANEYFTKAQQMNQGNLNGSRTSLMPSESDMIHSNYQRKANNRR